MAITINSKDISLMKSYTSASYNSKTVLTNSAFEYVELWLKSKSKKSAKEALFYWQQSYHFYKASQKLPIESKPLTAYYCCMNATKALLSLHSINLTNISHGVTSARSKTSTTLKNNKIIYTGSGVLCELSRILNESTAKESFCIADLLYNLPCIHRTYSITNPGTTELFIPISNLKFQTTNPPLKQAYLSFSIDQGYTNGNTLKKIPAFFEKTTIQGDSNTYYRCKKRLDWDIHTSIKNRLKDINTYHKTIRSHFYYIIGVGRLWYIKKELNGNNHIIDRSSLTIIYGIMHWMSELVRYSPAIFSKLLSTRQNWIIHEFVDIGLQQFIDEISCEITGCDIMCTGYRK